MVAACLVQIGDTPEAFLNDLVSARRMLHEAGMPHSNWYELKAVLALRLLTEGVDATPSPIRRLHDIYIRMRSHHWWKTGRDDLPACAILSACPGDPSAIADRAESVYRELARCGVSEGQSLQAAANILPVSGIEPTTIAHRYLNVSLAITECGLPHQQVTFATRAMLSLLDQEPTKIVARFHELYQTIGTSDPFQTEIDLAIAADLCFIDLICYDHDHRAYTVEGEVDAVRRRIGQQRAISVALAEVPATPMVVYGPMYP